MIFGLPPESLTKALMRGGRDYEGWGISTTALAAIFDAISLQTEVLGNWKDKPPKLPTFPRPGDAEREQMEAAKRKPTTVADLFARFQTQ